MPRNNPPITFANDRLSTRPLRDIRAAQRAGYDAGWDGRPFTTCPYRYNPDEPGKTFDRELAIAWSQGFSAAQTDLRIHRKSTPKAVRDAHGKPGKL